MVGITRLLAIMHIAICMPLRFLMGKTHEWAEEFDWGVVELGEALTCWYDAMVHLKEKPEDYLNKDFMLSIFDSIKPKLRPFQEYLDFMFEEKMTASVGGTRRSSCPSCETSCLILSLRQIKNLLSFC